MQNMKASLLASKELGEYVKEASVIQEHNTKVVLLLQGEFVKMVFL